MTRALTCTLSAPRRVRSGEPVGVTFRLANRASTPLFVLVWRTPFDGLFGNDFCITREGVELRYRGPMLKRGDPEAEDYLRLEPSASEEAEVDLSLAYDMREPGRYQIAFRGPLMDVTTNEALVPRPLSQHEPLPLPCPVVELEVVA